ncbi:cysteine-rich CWC family protein [Labilibacter marinus]|uniref:cysteine-rich CWC family protein n=1 Tax=Labilibacter marinus TaxID=1477105 RepID=UPI0008317BDB|nr:cysteine-rich CWC family protein [Labilibacter marinus]
MIKECPKCSQAFNCRNDEIFECHCIYVPVSGEAQKYLAEKYKDCLCNICLREVAAMFSSKLVAQKECCSH